MDVAEFVNYVSILCAVLAIAFVIYLVSSLIISNHYEEHIITGKVLEKEIVSNDYNTYGIICTDKEFLSTKKPDLYNRVKENYTYNFTVYGDVNSKYSMYRKIKEVDDYKPRLS